MTIYTWENQRPNLTVERLGAPVSLGSSTYNAHSYRVTANRELKREDIRALREAGWLGYGHQYRLSEPELLVETYFPKGNNYFGEPNVPQTRRFYVYSVTDVVDSSD